VVTAVLGCYNDSTAAMGTAAGWVGMTADHDDVTRENCAALCFGQHRSVGTPNRRVPSHHLLMSTFRTECFSACDLEISEKFHTFD
jgi:hypothetical protein